MLSGKVMMMCWHSHLLRLNSASFRAAPSVPKPFGSSCRAPPANKHRNTLKIHTSIIAKGVHSSEMYNHAMTEYFFAFVLLG